MGRKKILILSYSELNKDPRILRQISALQEHYDISTAGFSAARADLPFFNLFTLSDFHYVYPLPLKKLVSFMLIVWTRIGPALQAINLGLLKILSKEKYYERKYWMPARQRFFNKYKNETFDLLLSNDIETLPLAVKLAQGKTKILFDAHEYHPRELENNAAWMEHHQPYVQYLCETYLSKTDSMFTVCQGIAEEYEKNFSVKPIVITNATDYFELTPSSIDPENIRMIHHGAAIAERHIETMIETSNLLEPRFSLDLMLLPTQQDYYEKIKKMVEGTKVKLLPPVPTSQIPVKTNEYDIGLFLLPPVNFNYEHALPNKLFEFIQARLAIAIGPSPEMAAYVKKYDLGIISSDFSPSNLARKINALQIKDIEHYKQQCNTFAFELSANKNKEIILNTVRTLIG
jgi:hypothetical protein